MAQDTTPAAHLLRSCSDGGRSGRYGCHRRCRSNGTAPAARGVAEADCEADVQMLFYVRPIRWHEPGKPAAGLPLEVRTKVYGDAVLRAKVLPGPGGVRQLGLPRGGWLDISEGLEINLRA